MTFINYAAREINCKIVYYGPGLGGKTTNIKWVYEKTNPNSKGKKSVFPICASKSADVPARPAFLKGNEPQTMFDLPERGMNQHFRRPFIRQFLAERQFPRPHRGIFTLSNAWKCGLGDGAGADEPEPRAAKQVPQIGIFQVGTSVQRKFVAKQIAEVSRGAPLENALLACGE